MRAANIQSRYRRLSALLGDRYFFWGVIGLLVLQAAWIAASGLYPMAFDEDFHLGIIRLYAHHISPFWSSQPNAADALGPVLRDPSYLYHWLMSFPYRLIAGFTSDQTIQVLVLRAINIGLFAWGLTIFRRLLLKTGASRAIVHSCLLIFVLIPVAPLLAAQINYDNLFLPVVGITLLLTIELDRRLSNSRLQINPLMRLLTLCLLASLIKYAFLPIFIAIVVYLLVRIWRQRGHLTVQMENNRFRTIMLAVALIFSLTLAVQRYGVNLVRYHTPVPDCSQVLSVETCNHYGPWSRDHFLETHKPAGAPTSPFTFGHKWLYGMWLRLFFAVDGPATNFQTRGPLILPGIGAIVFAGISVVAVLCYGRRIWRDYDTRVLTLLSVVSALYLAILWLDGYRTFLRVGQPVAINGRYLFPVLPFLLLIGALALNSFLRKRNDVKLLIGGLAVLCLLWGGGALTYILRSNTAWYWPAPFVTSANRSVQNMLGPVTPGYNKPEEFVHQ